MKNVIYWNHITATNFCNSQKKIIGEDTTSYKNTGNDKNTGHENETVATNKEQSKKSVEHQMYS